MWVNQEDVHTNKLLQNFKALPPSIRTRTLATNWQPSTTLFYPHPLMFYDDAPINISTPSPQLSPTTLNTLEEPVCQSPAGTNAGTLIIPGTTNAASPPPFRPLITRNRRCSTVPPLELAELGVLCCSIHQYQMQHGFLPEPLRDAGLFHAINATTVRLYVGTNGEEVDPNIYNYNGWSTTL